MAPHGGLGHQSIPGPVVCDKWWRHITESGKLKLEKLTRHLVDIISIHACIAIIGRFSMHRRKNTSKIDTVS